jgi:PAS domain S-box-containing protein
MPRNSVRGRRVPQLSPGDPPPPGAHIHLPGTLDDSRWLVRWFLAAAFFLIALWTRFELTGLLPSTGFPFLTFFPAVLLTTYCVGLAPGLAVSVASVAAAWYFFVTPAASFALSTADTIALVFFGAILLVDCAVIHLMRNAMKRSSGVQLRLATSEQRLRGLLDGLFVQAWLLDRRGCILELNRASLERAGRDPYDAIGRELWADLCGDGDPQGCEALRSAAQAAASGQTVRQDLRLQDGCVLDVQVGPVRDRTGAVSALLASAVDVSDRVRAETAARESEDRFRTIADSIPQLAWMGDSDGAITWYNRQWYEFTGIAPGSMDGGDWQGAHHPDHRQRVVELVRERVAAGVPWEDTFPLRAKDGSYRWFLSRALPTRDARGQVVRWFGTNTDITEQLAVEESLREADRQKDIFLATLAHELRNPLAPIRAAAKIVALSHGGQPRLVNAAAVIERQSAHLNRLVEDLLDLSRIRSGRLELRLGEGDLRQAVEGALETVDPLVHAARQTVTLHLVDESLPLRFDQSRSMQCIANVLHNAIKFSPPASSIDVVMRREGALARVLVRDQGEGISPEMIPHVFGLFVQERHSGTGDQSGLGIGLALTSHLMTLHGGAVRVRSSGRGKGTEVELDWPMRDEGSIHGARQSIAGHAVN